MKKFDFTKEQFFPDPSGVLFRFRRKKKTVWIKLDEDQKVILDMTLFVPGEETIREYNAKMRSQGYTCEVVWLLEPV